MDGGAGFSVAAVLAFSLAANAAEETATADGQRTVEETYPGLATGVLTFASLSDDLPDGVLLRSDDAEITAADIEQRIARESGSIREELEANAFFVLEKAAAHRILLAAARRHAAAAGEDPAVKSENALMRAYVEEVGGDVEVSESDIARFYEENKAAFCGATMGQVRDQIGKYLLEEKKGAAVSEHIRTYGRANPINVSSSWAKGKLGPARKNPIDRVRWNGKPTFVDFGGSSCCGPDGMVPVMERLKADLGDKVDIVYVEAREHPVLAARYGVRSIPAQRLFNAKGVESYRHSGAMTEADIRERLKSAGME